VLRAVAVVC